MIYSYLINVHRLIHITHATATDISNTVIARSDPFWYQSLRDIVIFNFFQMYNTYYGPGQVTESHVAQQFFFMHFKVFHSNK
jgi:hypothetical protein